MEDPVEDKRQLAYLRASVRECGFNKKIRANPSRCGTLDRSLKASHLDVMYEMKWKTHEGQGS